MAGRRIKRLTYSCRQFNEMAEQCGAISNHEVSIYLRGATHVSDLQVVEIAKTGDAVEVFVESSTFPELSCCYKREAPEWTLVTLGEQRG